MSQYRILVVDDDENVCEYFKELFERRNHNTDMALGGLEALSLVAKNEYDLILLDIKMPDLSGHEVLSRIKKTSPYSVVIMTSAYSSIPDAVRAIRDGAYDYLPKPFKERDFDLLLKRAFEYIDIYKENRRLKSKTEKVPVLIGKSPTMQRIKEIIESIADSRITVLITGPSGTGKEVVSRLIHFKSNRNNKAFIQLNCAALPDTLLESELFGYVKGAFTGADKDKEGKFEAADGGTILLDEISETSQAFQAKLLRVIQEREFSPIGSNKLRKVDVRIIATSNRDLPNMVQQGKFREDLYFRLNVIPIYIPPLVERREDIPFLADYFLRKYIQENGKSIKGFSRDALRILRQYSFPGNARELENIVERAVVLCASDYIEPRDLAMDQTFTKQETMCNDLFNENLTMSEIEKRVIINYLNKTGGNRSQVARILNVSVRTIRNKLIDYRKEGVYVSSDGVVTYSKDGSEISEEEGN